MVMETVQWSIQNKISRSRKSENSNSRGRKIDLYQESRIMEKQNCQSRVTEKV